MELFLLDAARWQIPELIGDPSTLTWREVAGLLYRHPPLRAMALMRLGGYSAERGIRGVAPYIQRRLLRTYGLEIKPGRHVAGGCYIAHPVGCTLRAAQIGENTTIIGAVTLGAGNDPESSPTIGARVFLGVGCRVLGDIDVGDDAKVGANAVVLHDVPASTTVVGIPAAPVKKSR